MSDVTVTLTYSPDEARRVANLVRTVDRSNTLFYDDHDRLLLIASAIERSLPKPKPTEPTGLGAVVEDSSHIKWVRVSNTPGTFPWVADGRGVEGWSQINAVRTLSEGVTQ